MKRTCFALLAALYVSVACIVPAFAMGSGPAPEPVAPRSADAEYNKGLQNKAAQRYSAAVADYRRAIDLRQDFPEAWNELGFALRHIGRYAEAIRAYDHALRLRPNFPEALEYLGEAYLKMGRREDARVTLVRLRGLDPSRARELEEVIESGK
jgi:tetratricopeptide (TPR) repeat protein